MEIYGFEVFERKSFEKLWIKLWNEKIKKILIEMKMKYEKEEYRREGIEWEKIDYFKKKVICEMIEEKKKGII